MSRVLVLGPPAVLCAIAADSRPEEMKTLIRSSVQLGGLSPPFGGCGGKYDASREFPSTSRLHIVL